MTIEELENAKRRALDILDQWLDAAGVIEKNSPHYQELQRVVEDAVHCGAQAATGVTEQSECKVPESDGSHGLADITEMDQTIFILAGTSSEYTAARQQLNLSPIQAYWLTGASQLKGLSSPTIYRIGSWRSLARIEAINGALAEAKADIIDL